MIALHVETPTIRSESLSAMTGRAVWLKLETAQPVGSFKIRGIGNLCRRAVEAGARRIISSSGGNAGLAAAYSGRMLHVPVTVVVPQTTPGRMRTKIAAQGAQVIVRGAVWDEAHEYAKTLASATDATLVHPFDHPDIWTGHATLIAEAAPLVPRPGVVVVAVGGGGLLCGVAEGMHNAGWDAVPIVAAETHGAASYKAALDAGHPVAIAAITTVAKNLGARTVCRQAVTWASQRPVHAWQTDDSGALDACRRFHQEHEIAVEASCGAALAAVYGCAEPITRTTGPVLIVVCGGAETAV